ncbi:MAG: 2-oxoacid:acceptor oxidoreductase family protein [Nitrospirota bacterium]
MMTTKSFVFTGSGGQGVITAAIILGEAAAIYEGLNAVQTQVYGPEARGGSTRADVVISQDPIRYPKVASAHVLVCLTQEAYNKYGRIVQPGGLLLIDPLYVSQVKNSEACVVSLPMFETTRKEIGNPVVFNICVLGCLLSLTNIVKPESVLKALQSKIAPAYLDMNTKALELGMAMAKKKQQ